MMTSAQVVETSVNVTNNSFSQHYSHPDDQTTQTRIIFLDCSGSLTKIAESFILVSDVRQSVKKNKKILDYKGPNFFATGTGQLEMIYK